MGSLTEYCEQETYSYRQPYSLVSLQILPCRISLILNLRV